MRRRFLEDQTRGGARVCAEDRELGMKRQRKPGAKGGLAVEPAGRWSTAAHSTGSFFEWVNRAGR
jgi:hypothetical protein